MPSTGGACSLSSPISILLHSPPSLHSSSNFGPLSLSPFHLLLTTPTPTLTPTASGSRILSAWGPPSHLPLTNWMPVKSRQQEPKHEVGFSIQRRKAETLWKVDAYGNSIPNQAESVAGTTTAAPPEYKSLPDLDYLQELLAIQQQGPRAIGFFGTRNMGFMHQQLIEVLSYAMVITNNHIYTSGASGTNAAVIRGALRAERPDLLTVILPQSLKKQSPESQELLAKVQNLVEMPHNDELTLIEASRLCNMDILSHVQQVICFAFHDSKLLMETCREAKNLRKIVTLFYLD